MLGIQHVLSQTVVVDHPWIIHRFFTKLRFLPCFASWDNCCWARSLREDKNNYRQLANAGMPKKRRITIERESLILILIECDNLTMIYFQRRKNNAGHHVYSNKRKSTTEANILRIHMILIRIILISFTSVFIVILDRYLGDSLHQFVLHSNEDKLSL